ncbi:hypothetical protein N7522_012668 [Penicillium canescens]|uniref:Uncharacterized protein n=1 Tax=Penicillium canescens TaxID=5083 RepID=A0AAD6HYX0_PENCN|nr:uncharacterized protein N7446_013280 [Penicillium canescens]KAJ5985472.1 hypothetical protein N7522_012668 [Penicillium canescens]KAJ6022926.1 hypothetical protein N7460_013321 [Penicillium canescens]KAJ6025812.1 hypothetical protein N7444_013491 [Penicillium canescens]KAJ6042214.1 hypothetical protein N7446_013280 [Penicillium canescens]
MLNVEEPEAEHENIACRFAKARAPKHRTCAVRGLSAWGEIVGAKELSERFRQAQFDALPAKHSVLINKGIAGLRIEAVEIGRKKKFSRSCH